MNRSTHDHCPLQFEGQREAPRWKWHVASWRAKWWRRAAGSSVGGGVIVIGKAAATRNLEVEGVPVGLPTTGLFEDYEQLIGPARRRLVGSSAVLALQARADAQFLHAFLLHFCSLGVRMTAPVEDWIRQASARCAALGLAAMSRFLAAHAHAEAGHHLIMIEDFRALAALWNRQYRPAVDADDLLSQTASRGVMRYCKVHNDNLMGATPYAQIAIEYEIEMLPLRFGEAFVARCVERPRKSLGFRSPQEVFHSLAYS